jgi:hypothetical protein
MKTTYLYEFNVNGSVHFNNILIYIQRDATLHSLFYLETALHVSGGTITQHQERKQLYLQQLVFVKPLLLPAAAVFVVGPAGPTTNTARLSPRYEGKTRGCHCSH